MRRFCKLFDLKIQAWPLSLAPVLLYPCNMKLHSILGSLLAPIVALVAFSAHADCQMAKLPDLPVTMQGPRAIVPVQVNGQQSLFMVDTGAFFSSMSLPLVAKGELTLGPPVVGLSLTGAGAGDVEYSIATAKSFAFDSIPFHGIQFIVYQKGSGEGLDGSIGQNILGAADVEFDLANGAIRLFQPTGCGGSDLAYWNAAGNDSIVAITSRGALEPFTAQASINGVKIHVLFDTGTPVSMLSLEAAAKAGVKPSDVGVTASGYTSGYGTRSQFRLWRGHFDSFKIGGEEIKNFNLPFGDIASPGVDMLVGADFFLAHRVLVSNSQHRIYFTYNGGRVFGADTGPERAQVAQDLEPLGSAPPPPANIAADLVTDAPQDAPGFARRAAARVSRQQFDDAIGDWTKAITLAPANPDYLYERGRTELAYRQPFLAMADLEAALKLKPDDVRSLVARAEVYWMGRQPEAANADLAAADQFAVKDPDARLEIGSAYESMHRYKEAIGQYDQWIAAHPVDDRRSEAFNDRCWARALLGTELDKALADCNAALGLNPGDPNLLDSRGLVRLRSGDLDKAIADYDASLRMHPNNAWSLYGRGLAKLRKGMAADGQADLQAATTVDPKMPDTAKDVGLAP
jgi:tetratricopeptide (TPR) repeat protein